MGCLLQPGVGRAQEFVRLRELIEPVEQAERVAGLIDALALGPVRGLRRHEIGVARIIEVNDEGQLRAVTIDPEQQHTADRADIASQVRA